MTPPPSQPGPNSPSGQPADPRVLRLEELQLDRALFGLSAAEEAELQILAAELGRPIDDSFEMTAAALDLAVNPPSEPLPVTLKNRLLAAADAFAADRRAGVESAPAQHELTLVGLDGGRRPRHRASEQASIGDTISLGWRAWGGWVAAAACVAILAITWNRPAPVGPTDGTGPMSEGRERAALDPTALLNALRNDSSTKTTSLIAASAVVGPPPIAGDIYWNDSRQEGVLRITGLPPIQQPGDEYQLWITDALRDSAYPVDGGLFRVENGQTEVKVLIKPRLRIDCATTFEITVERAGGVVVSDRRSMVATGTVSADSSVKFEPAK